MYTPDEKTVKQIQNNFKYHSPLPHQPERYTRIRAAAGDLAMLLACNCPASRELSLALTHLEDSVMWANAAIARNEKGENKPA